MNEADMTDAEINDLLERFDCTEPQLQRRIVAHFVCENAKLKKFKEYVHKRLDAAGVPIDPESPHKAEGCRIGGRLDVLLAEREQLRGWLRQAIESMDRYVPIKNYPVGLDVARGTIGEGP